MTNNQGMKIRGKKNSMPLSLIMKKLGDGTQDLLVPKTGACSCFWLLC